VEHDRILAKETILEAHFTLNHDYWSIPVSIKVFARLLPPVVPVGGFKILRLANYQS